LTASGAAGRAFTLSPLTEVVNFFPYSSNESRFRSMINTTNLAMLYNGVAWGSVLAAESSQVGGGAVQAWLAGLSSAYSGMLAGSYDATGGSALLGVDGLPQAQGQNSVEALMSHSALASCGSSGEMTSTAPCAAGP
jgi:hypothetical protein